MKRIVQPEILDSLPQDHPDAAANRRDLRLINKIMGNYRWFRDALPPLLRPGDRILEIGAGADDLGLYLRETVLGNRFHYCGLDLWSRPTDWPAEWEWVREDLMTFDRYPEFTVILANLILHQFDDNTLRRLGKKLTAAGGRLILANEPQRGRIHQWQLKLMRPLGLHPVSRHDGHVSIAAGFRGRELPELLGLVEPFWRVDCQSGFYGWNRTAAIRSQEER